MVRSRWLVVAFAMACSLALAGTALAADNVLKAIPKNALGFVVVNRLGESDAKLQKFSQRLQLPVPSGLVMLRNSGLGDGLDEKGQAALFFVQLDEDDIEPAGVLLLPTTDYDKLIANAKTGKDAKIARIQFLDSVFAVRKLGSFAAVAQTQHEKVLESLAEPSKVPAEVEPLAGWIAENEASGVLMRHGIEVLATFVQSQIADLKESLASLGEEGQMASGVMSMYEQFFGLAKKEASALALGMKIEPTGTVRIGTRMRAKPKGELDKLLAQIAPGKQDLLAGLPQGDYVFAGGGLLPEALHKPIFDLSTKMMVQMKSIYKLDEEQAKKMAEMSLATLADMKSMSFLLRPGKDPTAPLLHGMMVGVQVTDSKAYLDRYMKQVADLARLVEEAKTDRLGKTEAQRIKVQGFDAIKVTTTMPEVPEPGRAEFQLMMGRLVGSEGKVIVTLAAVDPTHLVLVYGDETLLAESVDVLKGAKPCVSADSELAKTAALLPKDGQIVGYWSLSGTVHLVNRVIGLFGLDQQGMKALPEPPAAPPIGFSVKAVPGEVQKEVVIHGELLQKIQLYVIQVMISMQQAR